MKRFIPIILVALMGIFTVSCNGGDDDNDPIVIGDAPAFSETEITAGTSILIENSPASSALTLETDGNFELELIDGNYYLKANTMGEAEVTVTNNEGLSTTDTISSWGVLLNESGVDYQGIVYAGDTISDNSRESSSAVAGDIIIPRYIEQDGVQTDLTFVPNAAFEWNDSITALSFAKESKIITIGKDAFSSCSLTTVDFSNCNKLEVFEERAFNQSQGITSANFSNCTSLRIIETEAFFENLDMETIGLEDCKALEYIEYYAFSQCKEIANLDLSNCTELEYIANSAFRGTQVHNVDFSNCTKLKYIGDDAISGNFTSINFSNCTSLEYIDGNNFWGDITSADFSNCTALESIGDGVFSRAQFTTLDLSDCTKLNSIGDNCFNRCDKLEAVLLSSENISFGDDCFQDIYGADLPNYSIYGVLGSTTESNALAKGYNFADISAWN